MVESVPKEFRGRNSRHTPNVLYLYSTATDFLTGPYPDNARWSDFICFIGGQTNNGLAHFTRLDSNLGEWMLEYNCHFPTFYARKSPPHQNQCIFSGGDVRPARLIHKYGGKNLFATS